MKHLARILSLLILVSATLFIVGCGGDDADEPSEKDKQIDLLAGTWQATSVTNDGTSHTDDYADFTIEIDRSSSEAMTYVTANRPAGKLSPWNANGTLTFGANVATDLKRGDNVDITYSVSGTTLVLTMTDYSGEGYLVPGRTETVEGDWVFTLTKTQ
jgi:hypothetical protein